MVGRADLVGEWVHSYEEDSGADEVYRPPDYDFPPARGRTGFELRADGSAVLRHPGPGDAPELTPPGSWALDGERLRLRSGADAGRASRELRVLAAEPGRLVVRPQ